MSGTATRAIAVQIVSAFIDDRDGGNLAGVVLDEPELSEAQMQHIATALGFSETAFVNEQDGGFRVDFFTPNRRTPDCGHATVAAFGVLGAAGRVQGTTTKFITTGARAIRVDGDEVALQLPAPSYSAFPDQDGLLRVLGIDESELATGATIARNDVAFAIVPLVKRTVLATLKPQMDDLRALCEAHDVVGLYVTAPIIGEFDKTVRMFAPAYGIPEESATGTAAGLLAAYLYDCARILRDRYLFEQGAFMATPSPSRLWAEPIVQDGAIKEIWVGGRARILETRTLDIPE